MTTVTRPALLSSVAYIMQAAGITLADLAQHMNQRQLLAVPVAPAEVDIDAVHRMPSPNKGRPPMGPRTTPTAKQNITFSPPKTSDSQPRPQGQAVETEATRRTIDSTPRPNSRIEAAPALPPDPRWPSFSSTPLGVNPDTGRPWA